MNFKESRPIYLQIADHICGEIHQGVYPEDECIPSVREYATLVEVNVNTVVRTYDYLQGRKSFTIAVASDTSSPLVRGRKSLLFASQPFLPKNFQNSSSNSAPSIFPSKKL